MGLEIGSFDWYLNLSDLFFKNLTAAIMHADLENQGKLYSIFPHMSRAHRNPNWDVPASTSDLPLIINVEIIRDDPVKKDDSKFGGGTFNRYLFLSGSFLTYMAKVIYNADPHNREIIRLVYPQMVAAYDLEDWDMSPEGFETDTYNSSYEILEATKPA